MGVDGSVDILVGRGAREMCDEKGQYGVRSSGGICSGH